MVVLKSVKILGYLSWNDPNVAYCSAVLGDETENWLLNECPEV